MNRNSIVIGVLVIALLAGIAIFMLLGAEGAAIDQGYPAEEGVGEMIVSDGMAVPGDEGVEEMIVEGD